MTEKKLKLTDLKMESFVTRYQGDRVRGGVTDPVQCGEGFTDRPTMCTNAQLYCIQICD